MKKNSGFFVSPFVDFAAIGGASVLVALVAMMFLDPVRSSASSLAVFLLWIINWPHFSMTNHRLYATPETRAQFPITAYVVPVVLLFFGVLAYLGHQGVTQGIVKAYSLWSPYHFTGQTIGICLLYFSRFAYKLTSYQRKLVFVFGFSTFFTNVFRFESKDAFYQFHGIQYPSFGLPTFLYPIAAGFTALVGLLLIFNFIKDSKSTARKVPWVAFVPLLAQAFWFVIAVNHRKYVEFVPAFHSLQYIFVSLMFQVSRGGGFSVQKTSKWYLQNVVGGAVLFYAIPKIGYLGGALEPTVFAGLSLALIQIHHFFVDGVVWKLKSKDNTGLSTCQNISPATEIETRKVEPPFGLASSV